jgi:ribosomal protein L29
MDLKELKKKKNIDLHKLLAESRDKLRELRFKDANKQLKNVREIRTLRKTISQILTILNISDRDDKAVKVGGQTELKVQENKE